MATVHQKLTIKIPKGFTEDEREAIATEVMDFIADRTREGKNKFGNPWPGRSGKYSKTYEASLDFKIAGKTPGQDVDLTASGELLDGIEILKNRDGEVVIGYEKGSDLNAKADGNIRGTYGKQTARPRLARPYLDITKKDLGQILEGFEAESSRRLRTEAARRSILFESVEFEEV